MASLVMIDIDNFKHINDSYGHVAGDKVIQHIATYSANPYVIPTVQDVMAAKNLRLYCLKPAAQMR
jgi:diguanylate cyclase (GGDEF)-like protein